MGFCKDISTNFEYMRKWSCRVLDVLIGYRSKNKYKVEIDVRS